MKTHYDLLAIERTASSEEVKRAFRREIARYHPDKVQHLGQEFQEIAAARAAELTEAYRILMDAGLRQSYDESLGGTAPPPPTVAPGKPPTEPQHPRAEAAPAGPIPTYADPPPAPPREKRYQQDRATTIDFLRRALLVKFSQAVQDHGGEPITQAAFDAAYRIKPRKALFKKAEPPVKLLLRVVPVVDAASVEESWGAAVRAAGSADEVSCLLLLGNGLSPAKELSTAISEQRRRTRQVGPVVIPIDMRDWEALFPADTPTLVRTLLEHLRKGR